MKIPKLLIVACGAGFVAGLFDGHNAELSQTSLNACLISFLFSSFAGLVVALLERASINRKIDRDKDTEKWNSIQMFRWGFFGYCAWILIFVGSGIAIGSIWSRSHRLLEGLDFFSAGIGLIISVKLAARILRKPNT